MKEKNVSSFTGLILILFILYPAFAMAEMHHVTVNINQTSPLVASAGNDITLCSGSGDTLHASGGTSYSWSPSTGLNDPFIATPFANPTTTTTYIVEVTDVNGCKAMDTVVVTVSSTITANAGADTSVCKGDTIELHATGGSIYAWTPPTGLSDPTISNPKASPETTTTYKVIVSGGGSCRSDSDMMRVIVNPKPPVPTITQSGAGATTLHSSSPTGNQWYRNGVLIIGATSQDYTVTQNGNYTVVVTGSNGCSSTSTPFAFTSGVQSETISKMASDFVLFPNPNDGKFTFSFDADQKANYDIELRDVLGRLIHQEHLEKFIGHYSNRFDVAFYPKGFYSLLVRSVTQRMVVKVLKY